jgi:hypothetical protein
MSRVPRSGFSAQPSFPIFHAPAPASKIAQTRIHRGRGRYRYRGRSLEKPTPIPTPTPTPRATITASTNFHATWVRPVYERLFPLCSNPEPGTQNNVGNLGQPFIDYGGADFQHPECWKSANPEAFWRIDRFIFHPAAHASC